MSDKKSEKKPNRYTSIIARVFADHYSKGAMEIEFTRDEVAAIAESLALELPKNLGDIFYSFRYRKELPESIAKTADKGFEWIIEGTGQVRE